MADYLLRARPHGEFMKTIVCLLAIVLLPLRAFATPITYIEAISGDLFVDSNPGPVLVPGTTFNFDLGVNTISGSSTNISFLLLQDRDGFVFTIPTGAELSNLTIDYTVALTNLAFADRSLPVAIFRWRHAVPFLGKNSWWPRTSPSS